MSNMRTLDLSREDFDRLLDLVRHKKKARSKKPTTLARRKKRPKSGKTPSSE